MKTEPHIGVTEFKARALALIEQVASGKVRRVVVEKRGKPVVQIARIEQTVPDLYGAMKGSVRVLPGTDLTAPIDDVWEADQ